MFVVKVFSLNLFILRSAAGNNSYHPRRWRIYPTHLKANISLLIEFRRRRNYTSVPLPLHYQYLIKRVVFYVYIYIICTCVYAIGSSSVHCRMAQVLW